MWVPILKLQRNEMAKAEAGFLSMWLACHYESDFELIQLLL